MFDGRSIQPPAVQVTASDIGKLSDDEIASVLAQLGDTEVASLLRTWRFWAREEQLPPQTDWSNWLFLGGRGSGKTKSGAEWVKEICLQYPGIRGAFVGPTKSDVRDTMLYGPSGILNIHWDKGTKPRFIGSRRGLFWPNGSQALMYTAEEPDRLRGPNLHFAWADELASWHYAEECWDMLQLGLRLEYPGANFPRTFVSTTPRPIKIIRSLLASQATAVTRGSTFRNRAFLSPKWFNDIVEKYRGSSLGRQEIYGEVIEDLVGALWKRAWINDHRLKLGQKTPPIRKTVIGVDPAASDLKSANECGIIAAGVGEDERGYVLGDHSTHAESPDKWGKKAIDAFYHHKANYILAEQNLAGGLVQTVLKQIDPAVPVRMVMAKKGKYLRAEPVAMLYEQGKVSHAGSFHKLEDQMCIFTPTFQKDNPGLSPDRVDACVYAIGNLMLESVYDSSMAWVN